MAIREVITVGHPTLRQVAAPVKKLTPELRTLIADMVETMHAYHGVGLAAVQVNEPVRVIVVEVPANEEIPGSGRLYVMINPVIVRRSRDTETDMEGCLSVPGYIGEVERARRILVRGFNEQGERYELDVEGYVARVFQHEIDHLDGILYTDRLTALDRLYPVEQGDEEAKELEKAQKAV